MANDKAKSLYIIIHILQNGEQMKNERYKAISQSAPGTEGSSRPNAGRAYLRSLFLTSDKSPDIYPKADILHMLRNGWSVGPATTRPLQPRQPGSTPGHFAILL